MMRIHATAAKRSVPIVRSARLPTRRALSNLRTQRLEVGRILGAPRLQPKLTIGQPDDVFEREADRMADGVTSMPLAAEGDGPIQRICPECEEVGVRRREEGECADCRRKRLRRKASREPMSSTAPPIVSEVLRSSGQPLEAGTRTFMEARFGRDLSRVRVHTGERAAASAQAVNALAYTVGDDVVFAAGQFTPQRSSGKKLLAHELAHVVQQTRSTPLQGAADRSRGPFASRAVALLSRDRSIVHRAEDPRESSDPTAMLGALIENLERARSAASANGESLADRVQVETVSRGMDRLREVANGSDEALKLRVLAAFTPERLEQAEVDILSQARGTNATREPSGVSVHEQRPESLAAKSLTLSHPRDSAEVEADRVAEAVVSGSHVSVPREAAPGRVNRFVAEGLIVAGEALLAADAAAAPVEVATGPPGWAVGLGIAAVAVVLIGAGVVIYSVTSEDEPEAEPAPEPDPAAAETDTDEEAPMCATEYPRYPECWELPEEYIYSSAQSALRAMKTMTGNPNLTLHNPSVATGGPCPGLGEHHNVRTGGARAGSITCCPCCLDSFPPTLDFQCRIVL